METFSALLSICAGNSPVIGEFPAQRPVTLGFDVFFDLRLNNRSNKQSWSWWFETQSRPLWCHCNVPALKWQCWAWPMTMHEYSKSWFMRSLKLSKLFFVLWRLLEIKKVLGFTLWCCFFFFFFCKIQFRFGVEFVIGQFIFSHNETIVMRIFWHRHPPSQYQFSFFLLICFIHY